NGSPRKAQSGLPRCEDPHEPNTDEARSGACGRAVVSDRAQSVGFCGVLELSRAQILAHRRNASALAERLPHSAQSLERAAAAGLQDSMPRAALLSLHARVSGTQPETWQESLLVQVWGPRYSAFVIAERD